MKTIQNSLPGSVEAAWKNDSLDYDCQNYYFHIPQTQGRQTRVWIQGNLRQYQKLCSKNLAHFLKLW
jgi:hypothetical protein